jgi:hypothetical protein
MQLIGFPLLPQSVEVVAPQGKPLDGLNQLGGLCGGSPAQDEIFLAYLVEPPNNGDDGVKGAYTMAYHNKKSNLCGNQIQTSFFCTIFKEIPRRHWTNLQTIHLEFRI